MNAGPSPRGQEGRQVGPEAGGQELVLFGNRSSLLNPTPGYQV